MITREPVIRVGIIERSASVRGALNGLFTLESGATVSGEFECIRSAQNVIVKDAQGVEIAAGPQVRLTPAAGAVFTLHDVVIGIQFHWERKEEQTFVGALRLVPDGDGVTAINEVGVEEYLKSVISSEMSAEAPADLLKAHAITSRSWLVAMLEREERNIGIPSQRSRVSDTEIVRWYDREDHALFDVCADDHCQRYQGISKIISTAANEAVEATRGLFLLSAGAVCDARFSKSCGGISEAFENCWEDTPVPYLMPISDHTAPYAFIRTEEDAARWIAASPEAFCNTTDGAVLRQVLPSFDQETTDFFRWTVTYARTDLEALLLKKSGIDFGELRELTPLQRGPSGRITRLRIAGSKRTIVVGKELEIRRWLSPSHLYSSAFVVDTVRGADGCVASFILHGGGWGHGVGLCQIGAAVMASKGYAAEAIVRHYFPGAELRRLY